MGSKIVSSLFERHQEENVKFMMYMFMMKLIGYNIYQKHNKDMFSKENLYG